jgi:hypothetical protein
MSLKNCCTPAESSSHVNVNVNVDVPKIIKYLSFAGILIVGIIFGTRCFRNMLEEGFFNKEAE